MGNATSTVTSAAAAAGMTLLNDPQLNAVASIAAAATATNITLLNEPGVIVQSVAGAGGNFVASVHATGITSVLEAVFHANNTAVSNWHVIALDASGNATIPVHFDQTGEYLNIAAPDTLSNIVSFPVTLTTPAPSPTTTITATTPNQTVSITGGAQEVFITVPVTVLQTGGASTLVSSAGHMTDVANAGSQLIFDVGGGSQIVEAPNSEYIGTPGGGTSTINAAIGGSDTIISGSPVLYNGTNGTNSLFVGGAGAATVVSAANEVAFVGKGGGIYAPGSGSFFFFGGGGADTVSGGAAKPSIWGNSNETVSVFNTGAGATFVAFGEKDSINAANAGGSNTFFVVNQALPSTGTFSGNTTLVGSNLGGDNFVLVSDPSAPPPAHTITIENWQASNLMFFNNYSAANIATANTALAAAGAGTATFTLSDNTTVAFVGAHPTNVFG
jgi:hypothetical protein